VHDIRYARRFWYDAADAVSRGGDCVAFTADVNHNAENDGSIYQRVLPPMAVVVFIACIFPTTARPSSMMKRSHGDECAGQKAVAVNDER